MSGVRSLSTSTLNRDRPNSVPTSGVVGGSDGDGKRWSGVSESSDVESTPMVVDTTATR